MPREVRKIIHPIWHIAGGLIFLAVPLLLAPRPKGMRWFSSPDLRDLYANIMMLIFFYLNYYLFIPKVYFRKKLVVYSFLIVLGFVTICIVPSLITGYVPWNPANEEEMNQHGFRPEPGAEFSKPVPPTDVMVLKRKPNPMHESGSFLSQVQHSIFLYAAVILFSILLKVRARLYDTERNQFSAELGSLKMQINPHFLFNTLNNIYAFAIREKAPNTASGILKLSGMMRYVVSEASEEYVSLDKEINYVNNYIELQKMRLTSNLHLSFMVTGVVSGQQIAPLLLISFIENAFKHGVNPEQNSYISIRIDITAYSLTLVVKNQKVKVSLEQYEKSGIGINNAKSRLALLYPKKHFINIQEDASTYQVQLTLQLK